MLDVCPKTKTWTKLTFGKGYFVFPLQIALNGKDFVSILAVNVRLIIRLSAIPAMPTFFVPCVAMLKYPT